MAKFYYNGILLPDIPTEHLVTNPYIWIRKNQSSGYYDLVLGNDKWYYSSSAVYPANSDVIYWYQIPLDGYESYDEWVFNKETTGYFGVDTNRTVLWSNYSIPNGSATSTTAYFPKCGVCQYTTKKLDYNGVTLPSIPTEHFATHPFVWIRKNLLSGYYDLCMDTAQWYYNNNNGIYPTASTTQYWYRIPIATAGACTEWEFYKETTGGYGVDESRVVLWSLQDISNDKNSMTVYFNGTSPVVDLLITKYLVRNNDTIYTVTDGSLVEVSGEINSNLFIDKGVDAIPDGTLLMALSNPEVLCWTDSDRVPTLTATVKGIPFPQTLVSVDYDMTHPSILGIEKVIVDATNGVLFAVSFDSGESWKIWTGQVWGELSEENTGMSAEIITSITSEQWNEVATTGKFRFRVILSTIEDKFKSLIVDYVNV